MKEDNRTDELNNAGSEQSASANTNDRGTVTKIVIIKSSGRRPGCPGGDMDVGAVIGADEPKRNG